MFDKSARSNSEDPLKQLSKEVDGDASNGAWSNVVCKNSKLGSQGMSFAFVPPEIKEGIDVARLQQQDSHKLQRVWDFSAMVYVVGPRPTNTQFPRYVQA